MIVVYSGWGSFVGLLGAGVIAWVLQKLGVGIGAILVLAGLPLAVFGWWLNIGEPKGRRHSLFWIPLQWWGVALVVVGVANTPPLLVLAVVAIAATYIGVRYLERERAIRAFASLTPERRVELEAVGIPIEGDHDPAVDELPDEREQTAASSPTCVLPPPPRVLPRRVALEAGTGTCEALDLEVAPSADGTPIVRSMRGDEQVVMTLSIRRVQLTGVELPSVNGTGTNRRCVADGAGVVVVTDQRLIGLITASRVHGMEVSVDGEHSGSALAFAVSRNDLTDIDLTPRTFGKRLLMASLYGRVTVRITPSQRLEEGGRWRAPEAGEIERALADFVAGTSTRYEPEPESAAVLAPVVGDEEPQHESAPSAGGERKQSRFGRAVDAVLDVWDELT